MRSSAIVSRVVLLGAFLGLAACQQSIAYINIPADKADVAGNDCNSSNVAHLEAAAFKAVRAELKAKGPVTLLLPPETLHATYRKVAALAGADFVLPEAAPAGTPAYEVRVIHVRDSEARVDVVIPGTIRPLELFEVALDFKTDLDGIGWRATAVEARRVLPAAATHQAPKPEEEKADAKHEWFRKAQQKAREKDGEKAKEEGKQEGKQEEKSAPDAKPDQPRPADGNFEA